MINLQITPFAFLMLFTMSVSGQEMTLLSDYNGNDYWLVKKDTVYGLLNSKEEVIVPAKYDIVFPALQEEFSFISKNGAVGLFDNQKKKEVIMNSEYNGLALYPGTTGEYYVYFLKNGIASTKTKPLLITRGKLGEAVIANVKYERLNVPQNGFYENGITVIDSTHFIHQYSHATWSKKYWTDTGDSQPKLAFDAKLQKSGVFDISESKFVIPNQYAEIEAPNFDIERPITTRYFNVTKIEGLDDLEGDWHLTQKEEEDPLFRYRYGLYSDDYEQVIATQPSRLLGVINGGFFKEKSDPKEPLEIFDSKGKLILFVKNFPQFPDQIMISKDYIYVGVLSNAAGQMEMRVNKNFIYDKNGNFIKNESFGFDGFLEGQNIIRAFTTTAPEKYDLRYGIYDLNKATYLVPATYLKIDKVPFYTNLMHCSPGLCNYYYECAATTGLVYLDQKLNLFEPTWSITEDIYASNSEEDDWGAVEIYEIQTIDELDPSVPKYKKLKLDIKYRLYGPFETSEDEHFGVVKSAYKNLQIIAAYHTPTEKPLFGLAYIGSPTFILPPVFSKMSFDLTSKKLIMVYREEAGSVFLERYFYE